MIYIVLIYKASSWLIQSDHLGFPGFFAVFIILALALLGLLIQSRYHKSREADLKNKFKSLEAIHANEKEDWKRSIADQETFAQILSHDIKQPLRNILTYARLIDRKMNVQKHEALTEYMGKLSEEATTLYDLVEDIYAFSCPDKERILKEEINVSDVLRKVSVSLHEMISAKNATVTFQNMPKIKSNKSQLFILFKNLIENGIKYNLNNPVIEIHYKNEGSHHNFRVEDNGIGIPSEYSDQVFGMFERLHSRVDYPGSGLGLAICKKIVSGMSGEIWLAKSDLGGCAFHFSLPHLIGTPQPA